MQPRLVFRTHYQVDEPAYMEFLIKLCTSPVQSVYPEVVAQRVAHELGARGKEFNAAAGRYAVDLARALGLITANNTWTDKGQLMALLSDIGGRELEAELMLPARERLLHFRVFLEADGGALLYLARRLTESGSLPSPNADWNDLAKRMFIEVYSDYLAITNNTAERVALRREIDRLKGRGYEGKTGAHKVFIHLQTLYRLGLALRPDGGASRVYRAPISSPGTRSGIEVFVADLSDVVALERVLKSHLWIDVAAKVFQIPCTPYISSPESGNGEDVLSLVVPHYLRLVSQGIPLCPLSTLIEAVQIDLLVLRSELLPHDEALRSLTKVQRTFPKDVRFHVDRRGQPAFLKLSDRILKQFSGKKVLE